MMKIPLRDLKVAFLNPAKYAKAFRPGNGQGHPSKYGMLLFAIGEFHKTGDPHKAQQYLDDKITSNFKNVSDLAKYVKWLDGYIREFKALGNYFANVRNNISMPLPSKFDEFTVSGQAARIDLEPSGGYAVWLFVRDDPDWKDDPRMPLLQMAYAQKFGVSLSDVTVGVFDFIKGKHDSTQYSEARVRKTQRALWRLLLLLKRKK